MVVGGGSKRKKCLQSEMKVNEEEERILRTKNQEMRQEQESRRLVLSKCTKYTLLSDYIIFDMLQDNLIANF
jgi:hypothetical protein